jgi:subtilisin family serine protease
MPRLPLILAVGLVAAIFLFANNHGSSRLDGIDLTGPAVDDEVLVELKPEGLRLDDTELGRRLGAEVVDRLDALGVVRLRLPDDEPVLEAIIRLTRMDIVARAEPNHRLRASLVPNDPFYTAQSGYLVQIEAQDAWEVELGDDSVLVAVLDSGIDLEHPDLQGRTWTNHNEIGENGLDDDQNGCIDDLKGCSFVSLSSSDAACEAPKPGRVTDDNGHGTFVSGIIGATAGNGQGVSGIAPQATILPVKILDCLGGGTAADAAQAILYAARLGARVANISFGADGESQTLASAIREAHNRHGMVIVAATGNEGAPRVSFPARLPETFAVASSGTPGNANERSPFSDWGPEVRFAAPGQNIVSTVPLRFCEKGWFCVAGQPYAIASGTSFAAPIVSGLAALIVSRFPNLSPEGVHRIIASTAENLPDGSTPNWDGAGRIRMKAALTLPRYSLGATGVAKQ